MKLENALTDHAILLELGLRIAQFRINLQLTQEKLAHDASLSKRTIERIESGGSVQLSNYIRVLRVLDLIKNLNGLIPEQGPRPLDLLKLRGKTRKRASSRKPLKPLQQKWIWDDRK